VKVENKATEQTPVTNDAQWIHSTKWTIPKNVTNLTAENQNLRGKNEELEAEKKNLTDQIQNMTTSWNELNVSRAQWSIDAYCPKTNNNRMCVVCQTGWLPFQSGCYAINNPEASEQKTWTGAQDDCIGKISDLAVVNNETEKSYISGNTWWNSGNHAYWIGLRVKDGNWKWVDGRNLTNSAWIDQPSPTDGQCAISVRSQGFKSVSCSEQNRWICKKKALTL
uniref:C-type lectin domain family 4 member G-like n=1 Tax=Maylandia zebra TaxID=106582 RepID=A0A3P9BRN9_9CICH